MDPPASAPAPAAAPSLVDGHVALSPSVAAIAERVRALDDKAKQFKQSIQSAYVQLDVVCKELGKLQKDVATAHREVATSSAPSKGANRAQLAAATESCQRLHRQVRRR